MSPKKFPKKAFSENVVGPAWLNVIEQLANAFDDLGNHAAAKAMRQDCERVRLRILRSDSCTERLSKGYYRVCVLNAGRIVATFYIIRSRSDSQLWSIWSASDDYHSILLFRTLAEAREHCINLTL